MFMNGRWTAGKLFFFIEVCCGNSKSVFLLISELCLIRFFLFPSVRLQTLFQIKHCSPSPLTFVFCVEIIPSRAYTINFYTWQNELLAVIHGTVGKGMVLLSAEQWLMNTLVGSTTVTT